MTHPQLYRHIPRSRRWWPKERVQRQTVGGSAEYEEVFDYLYKAPRKVADPFAIDLPEEDPDWPAPDHTQQVAALLRRMNLDRALAATVIALEMVLPEWEEFMQDPPTLAPEVDNWETIFPRAIGAIWVDGHLNWDTSMADLITIERDAHVAETMIMQGAQVLEQGGGDPDTAYIPPGYDYVDRPFLDSMLAYDVSQLFRISELLRGASRLLLAGIDNTAWTTNLALAVTYCLGHARNRLERWWKLSRRRLAMRDL